MSDRIDELVSNIEDGLHGKCGFTLSESSLNNLATIARKANERARRAEARVLKAEAEVERLSHLEAAALPLWNHIGCAGCGNSPNAECEGEYKRFIDALYQAVIHYNQAAGEAVISCDTTVRR